MSIRHSYRVTGKRTPTLSAPLPQREGLQIRLRVFFPQDYHQDEILGFLVSDCGLTCQITGVSRLSTPEQQPLDIRLSGTIPQLYRAIIYLESLDLKILGKSLPDGDSWYC